MAASATPPISALNRSRSLPRLAICTSDACRSYFWKIARATRSGSEPGAEMAMVLPLSCGTAVMLALVISPCSTPGQSQPMILRSAPRKPARMAEPGLDSMASISPASSALCASVPLASGTILTLSPRFSAKPRRLTIREKPASPFGSITPWLQALVCAAAGAVAHRAKSSAPAQVPMIARIMAVLPAKLFSDQLQRLCAQRCVNDLVDVAGARQGAVLHKLLLHPCQLFHRQRDFRIDRLVLHELVVHEGRARIVGL